LGILFPTFRIKEDRLIMVALAAAALYLIVCPFAARTTLGIAVLRMRLRSRSGLPLGHLGGALYGFLLLVRAFMWVLMVVAVTDLGRGWPGGMPAALDLGVALGGSTVEVLDGLMIHYGRRRQGLFLILAGASLVRRCGRSMI
jgi:hypothetical protein